MLDKIVQEWNEPYRISTLSAEDIQTAAAIYKEGVEKQYLSQQPFDYVRVSGLGKPGLDIHAHILHPEWFTSDKTERLIQLFHAGDTWEADFYLHLRRWNYEVLSLQSEVDYLGVKGHTDMVVLESEEPLLLELKTCSANRFNSMVGDTARMNKLSPLEKQKQCIPLTYRTQLAIYQHEKKMPACWVLYNKDTSDIAVVPYVHDQEVLDRVDYIIESLQHVHSWEQAYDWFSPPPPEAEKFKNSLTGNYKVPQCVCSQLAPHIYDIVEQVNGYKKMTQYVLGYRNWDGTVSPIDEG